MALPALNFLSHLKFFKVREITVLKYGFLMLLEPFPNKVILDPDFTDKAVVQCGVSVKKNIFVDADNL